ncbi:NAD(P)H-dependent oxidoreductase [Maribacter sp. MMG018]|uniref:NADPH-dependent FMN reductase n=1 Tax=Maribacter sp. MMG018 TaxID=2822688 RepID=UPI001B36F6A9|nr:NAD(P)H-dependent oxidoreductase [Maribacter sp. MMG018]MBQ4915419.1 NAD(P)H-dependent oxidoreductase [Maribacter sp. MMG018]
MAYIFGFAGSNSSTSINYQLVNYTASLIEDREVRLMNMYNCPFPMYSEDYERENGFSNSLVEFKNDIQAASGILISVNEHNSNPSAYFKNLIDWLSRLDREFIKDKKVMLMATSGGKRGAIGSLEVCEKLLARFGAIVTGTFSLPSYYENFDKDKGIVDADLAKAHGTVLKEFLEATSY